MGRDRLPKAVTKRARALVTAFEKASKHLSTEEGVHEARVALRRLRSLWRVAEALGDRKAERLRRKAGRTARALGDARELDVLAGRLAQEAGSHGLGELSATGWLDQIEAARCLALGKAEESVQRKRHAKWLESAKAWSKKKARLDLDQAALEVLVADHLAAIAAYREAATPDSLHQLRIRAKRLRYLLETLPGRSALVQQAIHDLTQVQDLLGEARDARAAAVGAERRGLSEYAKWLLGQASEDEERGLAASAKLVEDLSPRVALLV
ncbi:MAG: CHAD domain-containing protein [Fimbriimonadaceae bacterium]|nr:MAG: CHAD domain-containing protein [Fimbriimonadaceae bacterium]